LHKYLCFINMPLENLAYSCFISNDCKAMRYFHALVNLSNLNNQTQNPATCNSSKSILPIPI